MRSVPEVMSTWVDPEITLRLKQVSKALLGRLAGVCPTEPSKTWNRRSWLVMGAYDLDA